MAATKLGVLGVETNADWIRDRWSAVTLASSTTDPNTSTPKRVLEVTDGMVRPIVEPITEYPYGAAVVILLLGAAGNRIGVSRKRRADVSNYQRSVLTQEATQWLPKVSLEKVQDAAEQPEESTSPEDTHPTKRHRKKSSLSNLKLKRRSRGELQRSFEFEHQGAVKVQLSTSLHVDDPLARVRRR